MRNLYVLSDYSTVLSQISLTSGNMIQTDTNAFYGFNIEHKSFYNNRYINFDGLIFYKIIGKLKLRIRVCFKNQNL